MADDENLSDQDAERLANFVARATTASDRMTRETTRLQEGHARLRQQFGDEAVREWYDEAQAFVTDQTSAAGGSDAPPAAAPTETLVATTTAAADDGYAHRLGSYTQRIHTTSPTAQRWFDRGCVWAFAFHREEAAHCFGEAAKADPACAMAQWGIALAHGPDYNVSGKSGYYALAAQPAGYPSLNVATAAIGRAVELAAAAAAAGAPPRERALIDAMATRYEWPIADGTPALQQTYADAMGKVAAAYPDDADVHAVHAEALMCLSPWDLYEPSTPMWRSAGKALRPIGAKVQAALDAGLAAAPGHVWLSHLKIHFCEMGPVAAFDWAAAEAVRNSDATAAGHLVHMPTHLDIQAGAYATAVRCNVLGYEADLATYAASPQRCGIYTGYVVHNMEFAAWAAMYGGMRAAAEAAAAQIEGFFTEDVLRMAAPLPTFFEAYSMVPLMVLVRFGAWEAIVATDYRADASLYVSHTLFLHFAKGVAHAASGELDDARAAAARLAAARAALKRGDRLHHNVDLVEMAAIADSVLAGEVAYRGGDHDGAFAALEGAVALFDALPYDEPHGWLMSVRQTLGALLAEQGRHARAIEVYLEDLELFPRNPWALAGLKRCYAATDDARLAETSAALDAALRDADVEIHASCACALSHWGSCCD